MTSRQTPPAGVFALSPVSQSVKNWMFALTVPLPLGIVIAAQTVTIRSASQMSFSVNVFGVDIRLLMLLPIVLALLITLVLWWSWSRGIARRRVVLSGNSIEVSTLLARERMALADLDLARARVVDLDERSELRPLLKLWGAGLPGFRSGWFLLRNRRRTLVSTAGGRRLLWLPTRRKFDLLLELQQPQAALDSLRERV